jgi:hypothetical protein
VRCVLTVATLEAINANEVMVAPVLGSGGSLVSGGRFYVRAFDRNVVSVTVNMSLHEITV